MPKDNNSKTKKKDKKISPCYSCELNFKKLVTDGYESLVKAIQVFGNEVAVDEDLSPEIKNEIVGILNAVVGGYPSTIQVASIFKTFSKIVKEHISGKDKIEALWSTVEINATKDSA